MDKYFLGGWAGQFAAGPDPGLGTPTLDTVTNSWPGSQDTGSIAAWQKKKKKSKKTDKQNSNQRAKTNKQ